MRKVIPCFAVFVLSLIVISFPASAAEPDPTVCKPNKEICAGKKCSIIGTTTMDYDQKNLIACLKDDFGENKWKVMTQTQGGMECGEYLDPTLGAWGPITNGNKYTATCPAGYEGVRCALNFYDNNGALYTGYTPGKWKVSGGQRKECSITVVDAGITEGALLATCCKIK